MATNNCLNQSQLTTALQVLIGSTGNNPVATGLTAGTNITITNIGSISLQNTLPKVRQWSAGTGTVTATIGRGYVHTAASTFTMNLPAGAAVGDTYAVINNSPANIWQVGVGSGQTLIIGGRVVAGAFNVANTVNFDAITVVCIATNTWSVQEFVGNITYA